MRCKAFTLGWLVGLAALSVASAGEPGLKVLIVDGQNNHNWKATTPVIEQILDAAGIFAVEVATSPAKKQPMGGFKPAFADYDVVVSNYNGAEWPAATKRAFEAYMRNGGGLVVIHASDNAFGKWAAWNEMIGVGGWGGRNEKSGPFLYWQDGRIVRDTSPGRGGTHGKQHPWPVVTREPEHPIMKGLPTPWMHATDELYSKLRGPAKNLTVLATAWHDAKQRGTGKHEPVLMAIRYGKGRVFHTVLGHAVPQMRCVGFIVTLQRGTEWAATGQVTHTAVPDDFPKPDRVSVRGGAPAGRANPPKRRRRQ